MPKEPWAKDGARRQRSCRALGVNPIPCGSVMRSVSTLRGMKRPQSKKTAGTFRPLERGIEHPRGTVLALVFGRRKDDGFLQWQERFAPFPIPRFSPDG